MCMLGSVWADLWGCIEHAAPPMVPSVTVRALRTARARLAHVCVARALTLTTPHHPARLSVGECVFVCVRHLLAAGPASIPPYRRTTSITVIPHASHTATMHVAPPPHHTHIISHMAAVSHEAAHYMMCGMVYGTAGYSYIIILIVVTTIYIVICA